MLSAINHFCQKLHSKCLIGFWMSIKEIHKQQAFVWVSFLSTFSNNLLTHFVARSLSMPPENYTKLSKTFSFLKFIELWLIKGPYLFQFFYEEFRPASHAVSVRNHPLLYTFSSLYICSTFFTRLLENLLWFYKQTKIALIQQLVCDDRC